MSMRLVLTCVVAWTPFGLRAEPTSSWVQKAEGELRQRLQDTYADVTSWTLIPMLSERQTAMSTDADMRIDAIKLGRRSALQVSWREGDQHRRQVVWFDVNGQRPSLRIGVDVKRNELIRGEFVRPDEHATWEPGCDVVAPSTPLRGMRTRKALRADDLLCAEDLEPKPPVSRGERVLVQSSAGLVTVVVDGVAEQDGNIGDRLRVRNPSSGQLYIASVTGEGEVVVRH